MNVVAISWRNVLRNGRRSWLTLLASAVSAMAILLFGGYVADNELGLQTVTVRSHGHLQIVAKDFLAFGRGNPGRFSIRRYEELVARLKGDPVLAPMLALVTPVLRVEGVAGNFAAGVASSFSGQGVVPSEHLAQLAWDGFAKGIRPSASALREDAPDGGAVGLGLAQLLALCDPLGLAGCKQFTPITASPASAGPEVPDDVAALGRSVAAPLEAGPVAGAPSIELLASSPAGLPNVVRMTVLKAERQAIREVDSLYVAMPLSLAQRVVFGAEERAASSIVVQLRRTDMLPDALRRIRELVSAEPQGLDVHTFHEVSPAYDQILATYHSIFAFIAVLMAVITLFSIANAVNMAVGERTGEIGTLRSLGFQRSSIRAIFVAEGAMLGALGALLGAAAAVGAALIIQRAGLSWTPPGRMQPIPLRVDVFAAPWAIAATVAGLTVVACASALWPASHAARLEVTEALRRA